MRFLLFLVFTEWLEACTHFWSSATRRRQADIHIVAHQSRMALSNKNQVQAGMKAYLGRFWLIRTGLCNSSEI
jgi:hypothetical protein